MNIFEWNGKKPFQTTKEDIEFYNKFVEDYSKEISFVKTTGAYVEENALRSLVESGILQCYKLTRSEKGSKVELVFRLQPYRKV